MTTQLTLRKRGRKAKPFLMHWDNDRPVHGLYKRPDGRWKILATGQTFVQPDDRAAVAYFRKLEAQAAQRLTEVSYETTPESSTAIADELTKSVGIGLDLVYDEQGRPTVVNNGRIVFRVPEAALYEWFRRELHARPQYVAQACGVPGLVTCADSLPAASIKLSALADLYDERSGTGKASRKRIRRVLSDFARITGYTTLRDLRTEGAIEFRTEMEKRYPNPETRSQRFVSLTAALSVAAREGKDPEQLRHAREVLKVLYVKRDEQRTDEGNADPVSVEAYRALLVGADQEMRALLLLALNCCQYLSEVLVVEWDELDLRAKTYVSRRNKTRVVRTAVLWDETVEAIKALPRRGQSPYVFA